MAYPKIPDKKTLTDLGVSRKDFINVLGTKAERLFFTYRFLMTTELNEFLKDMARAGIVDIVNVTDSSFKIVLENGQEYVLDLPQGEVFWEEESVATIKPLNNLKIDTQHLIGVIDGGPLHI